MTPTRIRLGGWERGRLWLSYQRYAFLLLALAGAMAAGIVAYDAGAWWLWLLAAVPMIKLVEFAREVHGRWPRKIRATLVASRRIESGRFNPDSLEAYCGDPCFRVVANEILSRAGYGFRDRRAVIRELVTRHKSRPDTLLLVDRQRGVQVRITGNEFERVVNPAGSRST